MKSILGFVTGLFVQVSSLACQTLPAQPTAPDVKIDQYMGTWYVISSIPTMFEKGAYNAVEAYTWNAAENRIDIDFHFNQDGFTGPLKSIPQKGFIYNKETNSEWRVQPFWPLSFAYLIVDLAPDYSWTVVGVPDRSNVWIMSRTPQMEEETYNALVAKLVAWGYDVTKLQKVPQSWPAAN